MNEVPGVEVNARNGTHKAAALILDFCQMGGIHGREMKQPARFCK